MIYKGKTVVLKDGRVAVLRSPKAEDAEGLLKFLQICAVETEFILRNADECGLTLEAEKQFILNAVSSPEIMMITAFIIRLVPITRYVPTVIGFSVPVSMASTPTIIWSDWCRLVPVA